MPASKKRAYARYTIAATELLGALIAVERKMRKMPMRELAERLGVDRSTLQRLEKGDPKVEVGLAFEACTVLGIPLFAEDLGGLSMRLDEVNQRLTLLPKRSQAQTVTISDDF